MSFPDQSATPPIRVSTREGYDRWAAVYDADGNPLIAMEQPRVDELLGDVRGLRVADIGCGTGRHAVRMAAAGARVTALDFSEGMLARARTRAAAVLGDDSSGRVDWLQHDLATPLPLESATFDRMLCALVLDHVHDLNLLFGEMARVVRPSPIGRVVVSVMHPAMLLRGVQARFTDPESGTTTLVDSVPNQISDYVLASSRAGLKITHMSEHAGEAAMVARFPRIEKYVGWPVLLMMGLERC